MNKLKDIDEKLNDLRNQIDDGMVKIKVATDSLLEKTKKDVIPKLEGFDVSNGINQVVKKMTNIGKGLEMIFKGLFVEETKGLGDGLSIGFHDIGEFMFWASQFLFTYIICGLQYLQNMHKCIFYYALDVFGKILYFPVDFINWIAWEFAGQDLYSGQQKMWETIYWIDDKFYTNTGFHFAHYPKNVIDMCYSCKRLRVLALKSKSSQINYDFEKKMPELLQAGIQTMIKGGNLMGQ
uniref:Uncharacterized protein n=1 Tax=viral metagenome TaxID=1070528 RepID=A0A6C0B7X7_9ZZZZ